jgi:hypothetical protein
MDAFMNKIERLAAMAGMRSVPKPLDCGGVMTRIRCLDVEDEGVLTLPLRFFAGGAAAAAVAAVAVTLLAATAWMEMISPLAAADSMPAIESLVDVMEML